MLHPEARVLQPQIHYPHSAMTAVLAIAQSLTALSNGIDINQLMGLIKIELNSSVQFLGESLYMTVTANP